MCENSIATAKRLYALLTEQRLSQLQSQGMSSNFQMQHPQMADHLIADLKHYLDFYDPMGIQGRWTPSR